MRLTNTMEHAVKASLGGAWEQSAGNGDLCRCPLCRADVMALALSSLPPRYVPGEAATVATDPDLLGAVRSEVVRSIAQVGRFPKHPKGGAVPEGEPVWVVNFPLEEGFRAVDQFLSGREDTCGCWNCRCDAVAYALNRYPARYGVEYQGRTHLLDRDRARMREELSSFLGHAVKVGGAQRSRAAAEDLPTQRRGSGEPHRG